MSHILKSSASILVLLILLPFFDIAIHAELQSSTNYLIDNATIGSGGVNDINSANYSGRVSAGELTVGNTTGTNYQAYAGFQTTSGPYLELIVNNAPIDIGALSVSAAKTTTATFSVKSYLTHGYTVVASGLPTSEAGATINPMAVAAASSVGTEQFGINLVANTSPATFGANPNQIPDSTFSFGQVATGYNTTNVYKYNQGDIIAYSNSSTGETEFTIAYLYNIATTTPAGTYVLNQSITATATY